MIKNVIVDQEFGFQKQKSTEAPWICIKDKITENKENENYTVEIFLDFKKAFDSIKQNVLIDKLLLYEVRVITLDLFKNYLSTRYQYTFSDHVKSYEGLIRHGFPQGSILRPLLFLIYINDIVNIPLTPDIVLYADNTDIFFSGKKFPDTLQTCNQWLKHPSVWLNAKELQLSTEKTKYIVFFNMKKIFSHIWCHDLRKWINRAGFACNVSWCAFSGGP